MERVKGIAKNGYHPTGKDGGKESWRGDHKGINQVASWVGKGKNPNDIRSAKEHNSRPLTALRDPDSFGPPPKNINYHGSASSSPTSAVSPSRRDLSSPASTDKIPTPYSQSTTGEDGSQRPAPPALPYRPKRTGINTSNIPVPPVRRTGASSEGADSPSTRPSASSVKPPKPNLPPRLPPRQNSTPLQSAPVDPPPTYAAATEEQREWSQQKQPPVPPARHNVFANQDGALSRLGDAGVRVPGLGIGKTSSPAEETENPWVDEPSSISSAPSPNSGSLSGLSSRFSNLSTAAAPSPAPVPAPSTGTTWAEKQAALKTASSFRDDPSSVSLSDAKATASTANNFRERHGDQVAQGWKVGNGLNKKYGIADRVGAVTGSPVTEQTPSSPGGGEAQANPWAGAIGANTGINRKPPPPPVPLGSKPR